jgi:hypothetical protein
MEDKREDGESDGGHEVMEDKREGGRGENVKGTRCDREE